MNILITSGGTKIPIDSVRSITNMSRGTFGAKIAKQCLNDGHEVDFLTHKSAKTPFKTEIDLGQTIDYIDLMNKQLWAQLTLPRYHETQYDTFWEYAAELEKLVKKGPDAIILACAASDYEAANVLNGKARTSTQANIELQSLPKLISKIRHDWKYAGILIGFKLLVGSTEQELAEAAHKSVVENGCDFVVANDLNDIKAGNHKIMVVDKFETVNVSKTNSVDFIISRMETLHATTIRRNR